ncbi:dienelactone hydrolase family protein [Myxococcaceae bacterium GXIMD 01537]
MARQAAEEREVEVRADGAALGGTLGIPEGARGLVIFAHGSGSSRHSPRNRAVARALREAGLATLLFDLLSPEEEAEDEVTGELRFDIPFLARRLGTVLDWARRRPEVADLSIGLFGSSTGAAAALVAAALRPEEVAAVVSRGGRPDLAGPVLGRVQAPTLLVVGGDDFGVLELNEEAFAKLGALKDLRVVEGATHLFQEPGALEKVASHEAEWFARHLAPRGAEARP